jgi:hypothetical protein
MFEQERFSCDLARSARTEEFREGHEQMDPEEEQIAHELETILQADLHKHKTAPQRRFMPNLPIRHPQVKRRNGNGGLVAGFDCERSRDALATWNDGHLRCTTGIGHRGQ